MSKEMNNRRGQGIVEYVLITALMALVTLTVFRAFRADVEQAYRKAGESLVRGVDEGLGSTPGSGGN